VGIRREEADALGFWDNKLSAMSLLHGVRASSERFDRVEYLEVIPQVADKQAGPVKMMC
jgi:hypothetical protein